MKVVILLSILASALAQYPAEFPPLCPFNSHYNESGTACPLTCNNYQDPPDVCIAVAVPGGCQCDDGYVRLSDFDYSNPTDSICVTPDQCPPPFPPQPLCPFNSHYNESGTACPLTCNNYQDPPDVCIAVAVPGGCQCDDGYVRLSDFDYSNPTDSICVTPDQCPPPFPPQPPCPLTCSNYQSPPEACIAVAVSGCQCDDGYVRLSDFDYLNPTDSICVTPDQCPPPFPPQPLCPFNSQYNESGTACPLTCNNYQSPPEACIAVAVSGCQCDDGYVRLSDFDYLNPTDSICVTPDQCPPSFPPQPLCPFNSQYNESGTACPLTCNNYQSPPEACIAVAVSGCQCDDGYVRLSDFDYLNPTDSICVTPDQCPPSFPPQPLCPFNSQYNESGTACPLTCNNYQSPPEACIAVAVSGCQCDDGYVRLSDFDYLNPTDSICVTPDQCPPPFPPQPLCPFNSQYNESGTACPLTCNNYQNPPEACIAVAVSGCQCDDGYVRLSDFDYLNPTVSICVTTDQCPPPFPPQPLCPFNSQYNESGTACPLTCSNYQSPPEACIAVAVSGCQCDDGYVRLSDFDYLNPTDSICVTPDQCPPSFPPQPLCPFNSQYNESGTACPMTCNNYQSPPEACIAVAVSGCQCDDGYVRLSDFDYLNPTDSICVTPDQCPPTFPPQPLCPFNSQYNEYGTACPLTCNNYQSPPEACIAVAVSGCQCDDGYVRLSDFDYLNPTVSICVTTDQCPPPFPPQPLCPFNSQYNESGTACPLTCSNYQSPPEACIAVAVSGCQCDDGYVRLSDFDYLNPTDSICVTPDQCPPPFPPQPLCPFNSQYNEYGTACPLTCNNYQSPPEACIAVAVSGCQCDDGYVRLSDFDYLNPTVSICVTTDQCPPPFPPQPLCPFNSQYNESGTACPLTCSNYQSPPEACIAVAVSGCQCDDGYVRLSDFDYLNPTDSICVTPDQCPPPFPPQPLCPFNSQYSESGTACPLTCNNYKSPPEACIAVAVSGCQCDDGYVRLSDFDYLNPTDSICVTTDQCPPPFPPQPLCPFNSQYNESGTACPLTCNNYQSPPEACIAVAVSGCQCDDGYVRLSDFDYLNPTDSICVTTDQCPPPFPPQPLCPFNSHYTESGTACPLTCNNYQSPPDACIYIAVSGCQCDDGYVRVADFDYLNPADSICVIPDQCLVPLPPLSGF